MACKFIFVAHFRNHPTLLITLLIIIEDYLTQNKIMKIKIKYLLYLYLIFKLVFVNNIILFINIKSCQMDI